MHVSINYTVIEYIQAQHGDLYRKDEDFGRAHFIEYMVWTLIESTI